LPAEIGPLDDRPRDRLDPLDFRHPIVQTFQGRGRAGLLTVPIFKHFKLMPYEAAGAATVLATDDGDPLIVAAPVGRGRVVLAAASADPSWSGWPLWPSFVPLVREIVAYAAAGRNPPRNLIVGDASVGTLNAMSSGFHAVRVSPAVDREQTFAVNVDPAESDLQRVEPAELLAAGWPGTIGEDAGFSDRGDFSTQLHGDLLGEERSMAVGLLYAALGLLWFDALYSWKLGRVR